MTVYRAAREYTPQPCAVCGSANVSVAFIEVSTASSPDERTPGMHNCRDCWPTHDYGRPGWVDYPLSRTPEQP